MGEVQTRGDASQIGTSRAAARIRTAAVEIFAQRGYGATSLRDIATRLGLSPGAVYPHYKTKESLLYAISLEGHTAALAAVTIDHSEAGGPVSQLERAVGAYVEWHAVNHALARVVQYELRSLSQAHYRQIATIRKKTTAVFSDIIQKGVRAGDFDVEDVDAAVLAISSLCIDVSRWFPTRRRRDPSELASTYVGLVMHMLMVRTSQQPKACRPPSC
ncbi:TetR family transcriptional regulator [Mycobacterium paraffinicum]|uniref:TetR family transcriptional regulator n=1 Tax=Mycobacterium paraffinicum TaxID=53378 RepID=A0A1Q4H9E5_9MYCO|nr:TetR/AcrR family transcriptional regulator [Mycobacterium paraffinicum]OJZ64123.1 TetR family transcriptional regulator [Mycobacterium paraffinicum]